MGSCVSVHKDPKSAMKIRLVFASKTDKLVTPSPIKHKLPDPQLIKPPVLPKSSFSDYGSKEETFFDSQAWLESDCDDDFFSVKGDFTPSVGNTPSHGDTPVHRGIFASNKSPFIERPPALQTSDICQRKKLFELFKDSVRSQNSNARGTGENLNETAAYNAVKSSNQQLPPKSRLGTPCASVSINGELKTEVKSPRSAQCCLPRLRSSGSFSEKRKSMSPAQSVGY